jgi:hypothetical protein
MKKIMPVIIFGLLVSAAVPALAQSRGFGGSNVNANTNAGVDSALGGVLSSLGQSGGSAKAGLSSIIDGNAVAKIMPAAGDKRHNRFFNKRNKSKGNGGASVGLTASAPARGAAPASNNAAPGASSAPTR